MEATTEEGDRPERRWLSLSTVLVLGACAALIAMWWQWTGPQPRIQIDHQAFLRTIDYQRQGASYYAAMQRAFHDIDVTIGHPRGYRIPTAFLIWRWIPPSWLWGVFLVGVVGSTAVLCQRLARTPWSPIVVTLFMLFAGRSAGGLGLDSWMLVELWLVPFAVGCVLAWRNGQDVLAAGLALTATMFREIAAVFLIGGLLAAVMGKRAKWPWLVAAGIGAALYLFHFWLAGDWVEPPGNFAKLFGTGNPPASVFGMVTWTVTTSWIVGAFLWALGGWGIWRSGERWLLLPALCLPLNGFLVDRPYWGIVLIPFLLVYGIDEAAAAFSPGARRRGAEDGGSSLRPGTPEPERGSPEAEPAPPSA